MREKCSSSSSDNIINNNSNNSIHSLKLLTTGIKPTKGKNCRKNIVTDLINALPDNGSLNTVQSATIEQRGYATHF
jgi:hypothetical protein